MAEIIFTQEISEERFCCPCCNSGIQMKYFQVVDKQGNEDITFEIALVENVEEIAPMFT